MELTELIPERVEWKVKVPGTEEERTFFFREFNLEDEAWLKREYDGKLEKVFKELQTDHISRIAYHQLAVESKKTLMEIKIMDLDEDGLEVEIAKKGPEKLAFLVIGTSGVVDLIDKLLRTRGMSLPLLEKIVDQVGVSGLEKMLSHK